MNFEDFFEDEEKTEEDKEILGFDGERKLYRILFSKALKRESFGLSFLKKFAIREHFREYLTVCTYEKLFLRAKAACSYMSGYFHGGADGEYGHSGGGRGRTDADGTSPQADGTTAHADSTNAHADSTNAHADSTNAHADSTNAHADSTNAHADSAKSAKNCATWGDVACERNFCGQAYRHTGGESEYAGNATAHTDSTNAHADSANAHADSAKSVKNCATWGDVACERNFCGQAYRHTDGESEYAGCESEYAGGKSEYAGNANTSAGGTSPQADGANIHADGANIHADGTNIHADGTNIHADGTNIHADGTNIHADGTNKHWGGTGVAKTILLCRTSYETTATMLICASYLDLNVIITDLSFADYLNIWKNGDFLRANSADHSVFVIEGAVFEANREALPEKYKAMHAYDWELSAILEGIISSFSTEQSGKNEDIKSSAKNGYIHGLFGEFLEAKGGTYSGESEICISFSYKKYGQNPIIYRESQLLYSAMLFAVNSGLKSNDTAVYVEKSRDETAIICGLIAPLCSYAQCVFCYASTFMKSVQIAKPTFLICKNSFTKAILLKLAKISNLARSNLGKRNLQIMKKSGFLSIFGRTEAVVLRFIRARALYPFGGNLRRIVSLGEFPDIYARMLFDFGIYSVSMLHFKGVCPFAFRYGYEGAGLWHTANGENGEITEVRRNGTGKLIVYGGHICCEDCGGAIFDGSCGAVSGGFGGTVSGGSGGDTSDGFGGSMFDGFGGTVSGGSGGDTSDGFGGATSDGFGGATSDGFGGAVSGSFGNYLPENPQNEAIGGKFITNLLGYPLGKGIIFISKPKKSPKIL